MEDIINLFENEKYEEISCNLSKMDFEERRSKLRELIFEFNGEETVINFCKQEITSILVQLYPDMKNKSYDELIEFIEACCCNLVVSGLTDVEIKDKRVLIVANLIDLAKIIKRSSKKRLLKKL